MFRVKFKGNRMLDSLNQLGGGGGGGGGESGVTNGCALHETFLECLSIASYFKFVS